MDFDRLRFVSERADSSETLISATIPERPGAFQVYTCIMLIASYGDVCMTPHRRIVVPESMPKREPLQNRTLKK